MSSEHDTARAMFQALETALRQLEHAEALTTVCSAAAVSKSHECQRDIGHLLDNLSMDLNNACSDLREMLDAWGPFVAVSPATAEAAQ